MKSSSSLELIIFSQSDQDDASDVLLPMIELQNQWLKVRLSICMMLSPPKKEYANVPLGAIGTIVFVHEDNDYEVEFMGLNGSTLDILTAKGHDLELKKEEK